MLRKQVKWLIIGMLLTLGLFIAASLSSCTEDEVCNFDEISQCRWETSPGQHTVFMSFEDGYFRHRITVNSETYQTDFSYDTMILTDRTLILLDDVNYLIIGNEVRWDCNQVYIKDWNGIVNCLDIFK